MLAIYFGLRSFENMIHNKYVRILSDNTTAISYYNNMGVIKSIKKKCNKLAIEIWEWCIDRKIGLTFSHLPGKDTIEADRLSRIFNDQVEWELH